MSPVRVLIVGAGVAGPTLAYFLSHAPSNNFEVTLVERSPDLRTGGQNVDVRGAGLEVLRKMGLEETVRSSTTKEAGIQFVDPDNNIKAAFPADRSGKTETFTADVEILRGRLAELLFNATKDRIEYIFGDSVAFLEQDNNKVHVTFNGLTQPRDFDIVVGADGLGSKTRRQAFGETSEEWVKELHMYCAFFTIPRTETDTSWSRWYNAPGRRTTLLRPDNEGATRAFISVITDHGRRLRNVAGADMAAQKALMKETFQGAGWETERVIKGMEAADDFYYNEVAQIKMPTWSKGRVVLIGDAGYCPTFLSGMGTTVGLAGAYILAGELSSHPTDPALAFANYEKLLRPLVNKAQYLPPGSPQIVNPETAWGIKVMNGILGLVSWTGIATLLFKLGAIGPSSKGIELGEYGFGK